MKDRSRTRVTGPLQQYASGFRCPSLAATGHRTCFSRSLRRSDYAELDAADPPTTSDFTDSVGITGVSA
jgi:hypothetical protein